MWNLNPHPFKTKGAAPNCRRGAKSEISSELGVGAGDFGEELAELGAIFFAGAGFDAAGYVYGVGADVEDGFGDVFGGEAAGENDAVGFGGAAGDGPVGAVACAAILAGF